MRSLAIENQESRKRSIDLVPNTCEWIESHPIFRAWEGSRTGTLWIRGQPGSGKSCLMKYLTDLLDRETPNIASPVVASFFFHGTGSEVQRSLSGFYRAVLNQLVAEIPRCCDEILRKFAEDQSKLGEKSTWETQELRGFLSSTLSEAISAGIPIIILADALDEAGQSNAMELLQFFRDIENTATKTTDVIYGSLRVCFSCRPYPIIVGQKHSLIIDVGEHNKADLSMFVRNKLKPDPSVWIEDNDLTEVQDKIIVKSSRTFQWAKLMIQVVLRMLTEMATKSQIQDQISKTPPDLHQLYSQLLSSTVPDGKGNTKYSPRDQALTLKLFQWLCFSNGPLTLSMIQHVLVLGAEEPDIACPSEHRDFQPLRAMATAVTKLSRGLVEIRSQNWIRGTSKEIVQFTHHSVYDFLLETGLADLSGSEIAKLEPTVRATKVVCLGHFQISKACIQAMAMQDTGVFVEAHLPLRLIDARQFRRLCPNTHDVREIMAAFRFPDCCYSSNLCAVVQSTATRLHESLTTDEIWPPFDNPEDLQDFMDSLEQHSEEMIPVALYGSQYLCHHLKAVESCDWDQMNLLDLFPGSNLMKTWPRIAELGSHPEMPGLEAGSSITHVLAGVGIASALKHCLGQDPRSCSIEDRLGKIPLHHAIENDENDSIKLLIQEALERGCIDMINHPDHEGRTPLHYALEYGMEETAQILIREALDHGTIDINRPDHEGRTPLHYAIEHGEEEVAQTLIQEAVDGGIVEIDSPDRKGRTPIFIIACVGNEDDMRQLLRTGMVNVERKDSTGQTPLAVAAKLGRTEIARLLVDTGASVESKDNSGCTPVFQAVRESTLEMTRYLVEEAFAKVDVLDNKGRGILSHAAEGGNTRIAEYIFTIAPTQLEVEDKNGKIPILYTSMEPGRGDAFDFLIKHMDPRSEAFLFKAAEYGFKGLLDYIFERGGPFDLEVLEQAMRIVQRPRKETARDSTILTHIERRINVEIIKTRMRKSRSNRS